MGEDGSAVLAKELMGNVLILTLLESKHMFAPPWSGLYQEQKLLLLLLLLLQCGMSMHVDVWFSS